MYSVNTVYRENASSVLLSKIRLELHVEMKMAPFDVRQSDNSS